MLGARPTPPFPASFRFGVATADHQCEAYVAGQDDVRDVWERVRGVTLRGRATDFWNRYGEDVGLAAGLGCRAFRLSLSWARLEPDEGQWSASAFEHYREVLTAIRDAGMVTIVTLHHNTWPLHVQRLGNGDGMLADAFPDRFAEYARQVATTLGDLIDYYVTINEPDQLVYGFIKPWWTRSYAMPPGLDRYATTDDQMDAVSRLIPNLFRAHARARNVVRQVRPGARVGANPFVFGFPPWLRRLLDGNATRVKSLADLQRHGKRIGQRPQLEFGAVDVTIAQLTLAPDRMDEVMFTESYFAAQFAVLGGSALPALEAIRSWAGRVAVAESTTGVVAAKGFFPAATIDTYADLATALDALGSGAADAVFGDDVSLRPHETGALTVRVFPNTAQPYAAGVAPGNRTLLNAIDLAIQDFKRPDATGTSPWARAYAGAFPGAPVPPPPETWRRATLANYGLPKAATSAAPAPGAPVEVPHLDDALDTVRRRGVLRVGIHVGVAGLCTQDATGRYVGLEPDLARYAAAKLFGTADGHLVFVPTDISSRMDATRSWLRFLDPIFRAYAVFSTILATNWWNLGMSGQLAEFLCPREAVNALDYVGIDYYWGINTLSLNRITHLLAAAETRYVNAPVWPGVLRPILRDAHAQFPTLPVVVVENGCVTTADGIARIEYILRHIAEVQRAVADGVPVEAYVCWSITSNREWGLPFDDSSDFGIYHIDLDTDPALIRQPTPAVDGYKAVIAARSAEG